MNDLHASRERREIAFSGRVQGVGFRYTTRQIAARHDVVGTVENLPDGRVWLVIEGRAEVLDAFLAELEDEMDRYIANKQVRTLPARGEFTDFQIVR